MVLGALHAKLVAAPRARLKADQRGGEGPLRVLDQLEPGFRRHVADERSAQLPAHIFHREQVLPNRGVLMRLAEDQRLINLVHLLLEVVLPNGGCELLAGRGQDYAGGGGVEPVEQPEPALAAIGGLPAEALGFLVIAAGQERAGFVLRGVGVRQHAEGFVEGRESVFVAGEQLHSSRQRQRGPEILGPRIHW